MNINIPLHLSTQSLQPFRNAWQAAAEQPLADPAGLIERCRTVDLQNVPSSLQPHIGKVSAMAALLGDSHWMIDADTRRELTGALAYFDLADDLIPDNDPRFGLLDDAIVIEMALHEHREVWSAWQDYRRFRRDHRDLGAITAGQWRELRAAAARRRDDSFVEHRYARTDQRTRYQMLDALPRIDLH